MKTLTLCENTFDASTWQTVEVEDVREFLFNHFGGIWPKSAHIYLGHVATNADITPYDEAGIERLGSVAGPFFVVVYPEGIELILLVVALVVAAVAVGLSFLLRPHPPANQQAGSPNNELTARQNQARPNGRIPDIFGQLRSTFDLLMVPYKQFDSNIETEHCYMCIGRGAYDVVEIRDGITALSQMDGASIAVFPPNNSPNSLIPAPQFTLGPAITDKVVNLQNLESITGQILRPPNDAYKGGGHSSGAIRYRYPNLIESDGSVDFSEYFGVGDLLTIGGIETNDDAATDPGGVISSTHLHGTYVCDAVSSGSISLHNAPTVNPNWNIVNTFTGSVSTFRGANLIAASGNFYVPDPAGISGLTYFFVPFPGATEVWCNFVCPNGCYEVDQDGNQHGLTVTVTLSVRPCDSTGTPTGPETGFNITLIGSRKLRNQVGATLKASISAGTGGILIRAIRDTDTDLRQGFSVSDQVQWRECYIVSAVAALDFGNITTVQTIIQNTPSALSVRDRKMNALVTRHVPVPSGSALAPSINAADIICAMSLDPFIGNLQPADVDIAGIYDIAGAGGVIETYFRMYPDTTLPTQFSYTFDDATISFEESVSDVATSIFCTAFRRGGLLALSFEGQTPNSTLLFNHRNKIPKSETRTVTFGTLTQNDGINLDYVEPNAPNYPNMDTTVTLYFPPSKTATNPKKIKTVGIRNVAQASVLGWRMYYKLLAQNTSVQFECTEEAALLVLQDRILVADNTRPDTQDGDVINQAVLLLDLSQNVTFVLGRSYTIFLQHANETVEAIPITAGLNPNQVLLGHAPSFPCLTDPANYAKTTYIIVDDSPVRQSAFLVAEKTPKDAKTWEVKAVNYDDIYYSMDHSFSVDIDIAGQFLEAVQAVPLPPCDFAGLFLEVVQPPPPPPADFAGLYLETMQEALPAVDFASLFAEVMQDPAAPNVDIASFFAEIMQDPTRPNVDIASFFAEVVQSPPLPNCDVDGFFLEVMIH